MKHTDIIQKLNLEQKCALLSGETVFTTRALPGKGIPAITLSDGPNGVRKQAGAADHLGLNPSVPATCFPTSSATACSWDEKLGEAVGEALGEEAAAQEVAVLLGPGLNIQRSPLCGRDFEYFSEDPILAGRMAAAYVRGIQKNGIAACPKHFAVNSQELRRMASDSVLDERTLRELYLTGFEIVVKEAKPKTIMTSYNLINGTYANENAHLLQDILRKDWGFDGAVVTDWGGSNDHALGVKNGSTLEMPCPGGDSIRELMKAVQGGKISEADVDARLDEMLELVLSTHAAVEKMLITGVAADKNTARISVMGVEDKPGTAFKIFNTLAKHNINVDIILQSVGRDGTKDITFTVSQDDLKEAMEVMEARKEALTIKEMNYNEKVAKLSIVGAGMLSNPGVAATMFESLSNSNININMISTSEIRITVLIDEKDADRALVAIHDGFGLED